MTIPIIVDGIDEEAEDFVVFLKYPINKDNSRIILGKKNEAVVTIKDLESSAVDSKNMSNMMDLVISE